VMLGFVECLVSGGETIRGSVLDCFRGKRVGGGKKKEYNWGDILAFLKSWETLVSRGDALRDLEREETGGTWKKERSCGEYTQGVVRQKGVSSGREIMKPKRYEGKRTRMIVGGGGWNSMTEDKAGRKRS